MSLLKAIIFISFLSFFSCQNQSSPSTYPESPSINGKYYDGQITVINIFEAYEKVFLQSPFERGIYVIDTSSTDPIKLTEIMSGTDLKLTKLLWKDNQLMGFNYRGKSFSRTVKKDIPIEKMIQGDLQSGLSSLKELNTLDFKEIEETAFEVLTRLPSLTHVAVSLFELCVKQNPNNPQLWYGLARSKMVLDDRPGARTAFLKALDLGYKGDENLKDDLAILDQKQVIPAAFSWSPDELFRAPEPTEIQKVKEEWENRDLSPSKVEVEFKKQVTNNGFSGTLQIVSYQFRGNKSYGAIFLPSNPKGKLLPAIVEAKGIDWRYSWCNLNYRPKWSRYLDENANDFIYLVPAYQGEGLIYEEEVFRSEGSPKDGWDGATDDFLAFTNVAINLLGSQIDTSRLIAAGDSRGGTVALLAGIRDSRFDMVINWAGPLDWFQLMDAYNGRTLKEEVIRAINEKLPPNTGTPGQFVDWYLSEPSAFSKEGLRQVRTKMIASSPLYFLEELPAKVMIHYGKEDLSVPIQNGHMLAEKLTALGRNTPNFQYYFHDNIGHNLNPYTAVRTSVQFIKDFCLENE